jgi:hypothetical protein
LLPYSPLSVVREDEVARVTYRPESI